MFTVTIGLEHPIVQAPMAGGATTPELVAAVSNAGALGSFAAAVLPPSDIIEAVRRIRTLTSRPFNVNLFVLRDVQPTPSELSAAHDRLNPIRASLGLGSGTTPAAFAEDPRAQLAAVLELAPPVVSFAFDVLDAATVSRFKRAGSVVVGTATSVAEARAWERAGADAICAQGVEAGGHRGTFLGDADRSAIGIMALVPQLVSAVKVPVVAAGGIMSGQGIAAALVLGAQAAQLGTAFLCCPESGIPDVWKRAVLEARDDSTRLTRVFSGRPARSIVNAFMEQMRPFEDDVPAYPVQNALTGEIRRAAAKQNRPELMSLFAGQGVAMSRPMPAADLVRTLAGELYAILPR